MNSEKNSKLISLSYGILDNFKYEYSEFSILNLNFLAYSYHDKVHIGLGMLVDEKLDVAQHPRESAAPWAASTGVWPAGRGREGILSLSPLL